MTTITVCHGLDVAASWSLIWRKEVYCLSCDNQECKHSLCMNSHGSFGREWPGARFNNIINYSWMAASLPIYKDGAHQLRQCIHTTFKTTMIHWTLYYNYIATVEPLYSGHPWDSLKCPDYRRCPHFRGCFIHFSM